MANKNREGALELSIGTIVVIVIGMSMLILGLVLVRTIFSGSTSTVDDLNEQVQSEILNLFGDSTGNVVVKLGSADTAKVKPGDRFNVAIGAQHPDGASITRDSLQYRISLADDSNENCLRLLGKERAEGLFVTRVNTWNNFDQFSGSTAFGLVEIDVPSGTARCTQKVNIDMKLKEEQQASSGDAFILEVTREGIL
ncbi:MAG: hypothetical protein ACP5N7_01615 [Candidatus Pacearchaeota archaeon]